MSSARLQAAAASEPNQRLCSTAPSAAYSRPEPPASSAACVGGVRRAAPTTCSRGSRAANRRVAFGHRRDSGPARQHGDAHQHEAQRQREERIVLGAQAGGVERAHHGVDAHHRHLDEVHVPARVLAPGAVQRHQHREPERRQRLREQLRPRGCWTQHRHEREQPTTADEPHVPP